MNIPKLKDFILDHILETDLFEMAYTRKKMIKLVSDLQHPINEHIIKLLIYKDDVNEAKHIRDINGWIVKILRMKLKGKKGGSLSSDSFYDILYIQPFDDDVAVLKTWVKLLKYDYGDLPRSLTNLEKVLEIVKSIHIELSQELASGDVDFKKIYDKVKV